MNYWIHRISYEAYVSYPLLEKNLLSIGFWDYATEDFLNKTTDGDGEYFDNEFQLANKEKSTKYRYSLWYFINEMDKGDWVIVPGDGVFSIYEILDRKAILPSHIELKDLKDWNGNKIKQGDEKFFVNINNEDVYIGFLRRVKPIRKDISRSAFADNSLTKRLKTQWTTSNVNDLEKNIKNSIERFDQNKPIDLKYSLLDSSVKTWLELIYSELNDDKFENLVCSYFSQIGCTDVYRPSKNKANKAGDVDVITTFDQLHTIIHVQAKFHEPESETDEWAVEQINEFARSKAATDDGFLRQYWVISSSESFSENAVNLAKENNILLINGKEFAKMLILSGIQKIVEL